MSDTTPGVRPLEPGDRERVREIHEASFDELAFDDIVIDRVFRHGNTINVVAELDDEIVGWAAAIHGSRPTARLLTIQTHPKARGQGVAKALIDDLEERLKARQAQTLRLEVHVDNEAARSLYEKHGFEVEREDPTCYPTKEPSTGFVMTKPLG